MDNIKLFRAKIPFNQRQYYDAKHTHLITISCEADGNVFSTPVYPISPNELKEVYQRGLSNLVGEIQFFRTFIIK